MQQKLEQELDRMATQSGRLADSTHRADFDFVWRAGLLALAAGSPEAVRLFRRAHKLEPKHHDWQLRLDYARALTTAGNHRQALKQLAHCVALNPTQSGSWRALGDAHAALGNRAGALEVADAAVCCVWLTLTTAQAFSSATALWDDGTASSTLKLKKEPNKKPTKKLKEEPKAAAKGQCSKGELVQGISAQPFHDVSSWPIVRRLVSKWHELRAEVLGALRSGELRKESMPDTEGLTAQPEQWTELNLYFQGN